MYWLSGFWPLWIIIAVPIAIEWYAIWSERRPHVRQCRTISAMIWEAVRLYPHFWPVFYSVWAVLLPHFHWPPTGREWTTPEGWAILIVGVAVIWLTYMRTRVMFKDEPLWTRFLAGGTLSVVVAQILKQYVGVELTVEQVSTIFVVIGAIVTALQRGKVVPTAKIESLEKSGMIQTPRDVTETVMEVIKAEKA